jgi:virulence factor Mce-like protein
MIRRIGLFATVMATMMTLTSCAQLDVNSLPAPGNTYSNGHGIVMEFESVLNLPAQAKVTLDGTTVGIVTGVDLVGDHVDVSARIDPALELPADIHAVLQQATVLGDTYIALQRPPVDSAATPTVRRLTRIPLAQTTSPPRLEDTIASLADFIGSGSIQRVQNTIIGLNRATPPGDDLRKLVSQFTADLSDLSNNIDTVDQLLTGVSQTAQVLKNRSPGMAYWFSPEGMRAFDRVIQALGVLGVGLPSLGSVYSGGFWLVPLLNSLADAFGAVQQSKWAFEEEVPAWRRLFTDFLLPQDKYPAINITSIVGPDGTELSNNVHDVLRILGAVP